MKRIIATLLILAMQSASATYDVNAALITKPYAIQALAWKYASPIASPITTNTSVALAAAGAAGIENYLTGLCFSNTSATGSVVSVQDNTTVVWSGYAAPNGVQFCTTFPMPIQGTAATAMNFAVATTGASIHVSAQGYIGY